MEKKLVKTVFVTVGTTQFDDLIQTICSTSVTEELNKLGYTDLILQIGNGKDPERVDEQNLNIKFYRFKNSIEEDISNASLVISHAGAGSILDVLGAGKPLLVAINENLMDNHQIEVAQRFSNEGFLYYCKPSQLVETLQDVNFDALKPYEPGKPEKFAKVLDRIMGFTQPDS
ncbi:hypothetical protein SNE40_007378 [Patella caerulea]|uniref:UDP-N-acetylglucosamine transferase subunit ALG13 n=1 Tax=Patella caerulea TaxID=87958 RepID=A0AAN8JTN6_PATCE